ncbi:hypothetical protein ACHAWO_006451 [Cyclotella atomus]|uniref:Uncharacterized protein n=1 Tax=Cyclotella atomus TaxID=382360 RepID=A0ABD3NWX9_9STRA
MCEENTETSPLVINDVDPDVFTVDNAVDEFLKADGNCCNVVKDAAKKFIVEHAKEIVESDSFARLHESLPLMKEVVGALADNGKKRKHDDIDDEDDMENSRDQAAGCCVNSFGYLLSSMLIAKTV